AGERPKPRARSAAQDEWQDPTHHAPSTPSTVWLSSIPRTPKVPHDVKSWQKRDRSPLLSRPAAPPARAMVEPERQAAGRTPAAQEGLQRGGNHSKSALPQPPPQPPRTARQDAR